MPRGHLIVFEGIDGSGTTTQAEELRQRFIEHGLPAHVTAQPSQGPIGMMIRQVLSGRLVLHGSKAPGWATMALLFAADRQDHQEAEIEPNLRDGVNVICDRYVPSSVIYQSVTSQWEDSVKWILDINRHIRQPDLLLYLKIDPNEAARRRHRRSGRTELYEEPAIQQQLAAKYDQMAKLIPGLDVVILNGAQTVDEIADETWSIVEQLRSQGAPE